MPSSIYYNSYCIPSSVSTIIDYALRQLSTNYLNASLVFISCALMSIWICSSEGMFSSLVNCIIRSDWFFRIRLNLLAVLPFCFGYFICRRYSSLVSWSVNFLKSLSIPSLSVFWVIWNCFLDYRRICCILFIMVHLLVNSSWARHSFKMSLSYSFSLFRGSKSLYSSFDTKLSKSLEFYNPLFSMIVILLIFFM